MPTRKAQDRVMNVHSVGRTAMQGITMEVRRGGVDGGGREG